jgi:hypothetical protein
MGQTQLHLRANYVALALVFAEMAGRKDLWYPATGGYSRWGWWSIGKRGCASQARTPVETASECINKCRRCNSNYSSSSRH